MNAEGGRRIVFCVSDHTGLTAETFAHSLVSRFDGIEARYVTRPFVDSAEKVEAVVREVNQAAAAGVRPVVFSTLVVPEQRRLLDKADALVIGLFDSFADRLSQEFGRAPSTSVGRSHGMGDTAGYQARLDAVDFTLTTDDGLGADGYPAADVIVVGVSRVGKTPTCLYLSMQYGIRAANYPLTPDDAGHAGLPPLLAPHRAKLFGLTIDPVRLHQIRQKRRAQSAYSALDRCQAEVAAVERLFRIEQIPVIDTTVRSIEEITAELIDRAGLKRRFG